LPKVAIVAAMHKLLITLNAKVALRKWPFEGPGRAALKWPFEGPSRGWAIMRDKQPWRETSPAV